METFSNTYVVILVTILTLASVIFLAHQAYDLVMDIRFHIDERKRRKELEEASRKIAELFVEAASEAASEAAKKESEKPSTKTKKVVRDSGKVCKVRGCYNKHVAKGFCAKHYQSYRKDKKD